MRDQIDGCANQYKCSIAYYLMSYLSTSYQIVIDRDVDTPGHGKDVVDGFNAVQKQYLATCLRMCSTPEKDKIDSKRMCVEAIHYIFSMSFICICPIQSCKMPRLLHLISIHYWQKNLRKNK